MADSDLGGDFLRRWLGAARFQEWFKWRARFPRLYRGVLSYAPEPAPTATGAAAVTASTVAPQPLLSEPVPPDWERLEGESFRPTHLLSFLWIRDWMYIAQLSSVQHGLRCLYTCSVCRSARLDRKMVQVQPGRDDLNPDLQP